MRELERRLDVSFGSIDHHVHVLVRQGDIIGLWDGHYRRLFGADLVLPTEARRLNEDDRRFLSLCRRPMALAVVLNLAAENRMRHIDLQARIGRSKATLSYHLDKLVSAGVVRRYSESPEQGYQLTNRDRSISLLVTFADSLQDHVDGYASLWASLRNYRAKR